MAIFTLAVHATHHYQKYSSQHSAAGVEGGGFVYSDNPMNKGTDYMIELASDSRFAGVNITASDFAVGSEVTFDAVGRPSRVRC